MPNVSLQRLAETHETTHHEIRLALMEKGVEITPVAPGKDEADEDQARAALEGFAHPTKAERDARSQIVAPPDE